MALKTVKVPKEIEPAFAKAEDVVASYFARRRDDPSKGTIEIFGERYVLVRAASLSLEFFSLIRNLFGRGQERDAEEFARDILFDLAHAIGKSDAKNFHTKMELKAPVERLSAGPVHFSHSGWAFVDISPESHPTPDEDYYLIYDHPYSFEADAWMRRGQAVDFPVCIMNAGYSSGWCEESFGLTLVASEILCRAKGDDCCRFIMAPPNRIEGHIERYMEQKPNLARRIRPYRIPDFLVRRRMEEALQESEAGLKQAQRLAHVGSWQWDLRNGTFQFSDELRRIYGLSEDDSFNGTDALIDSVVHPDDKATVDKAAKAFAEGIEVGPSTFRVVRPTGEMRWVVATYPDVRRLGEDGTAEVVTGTVQDITERRLAEQEREKLLEVTEERVRELSCMYGVAKAVRERETLEEVFRDVVALMPTGWHYPQIARGKIRYDGQEYVAAPFQETQWKQASDIIVDGKRCGSAEVYYLDERPVRDEGPFTQEERNLIDGIAHTLSEAVERQRAEEALRDSEGKLSAMLASIGDYMSMLDEDLNIIWANDAARNTFGEDIVGRKCYEVYHQRKEPCRPYPCDTLQAFRDGKVHRHERPVVSKDGRTIDLHCTANTALRDEAGNPVAVMEISRDVTEGKRVEEERRIKDRVVALSVNPIAMTDLEGKLTYANASFLATWGYDSERRVVGKRSEELWHMGGEATQALSKRGKWIGKVSGRSSDAGPLELQLSATLVRDEPGEPLCMAFSFVNVTEISQLRRRLRTEQSFAGIVGRDTRMLELFDTIRELAEVAVPVLIQGESGTGKELVAAAIHAEGPRADKPFVPVSCGALPEGILESELFGHVRGAFTGALRDRKGRFELADGGTIFLDEVGDIPPAMQVKLLRVLQEGAFERIGGERTLRVDVRLISATNKDLRKEVAAGRFREDLFYRLSVVPVVLPPLCERRGDIPLLAEHLLRRALAETGRQDVTFSRNVMEAMVDYAWPGNVRELENAIQYALVKCRGNVLEPQHLPAVIGQTRAAGRPATRRRKRKLDAEAVRQALERTGGNKLQAARRLGVSRATLYRFLENPGL